MYGLERVYDWVMWNTGSYSLSRMYVWVVEGVRLGHVEHGELFTEQDVCLGWRGCTAGSCGTRGAIH